MRLAICSLINDWLRPLTTAPKLAVIAGLIIGMACMDAPTAAADEYEAQTPVGKFFQGLSPQNWKMPKMKMPKLPALGGMALQGILPQKAEKDQIIRKKDGLMQEVGNTAKRSWQRTKDMVNPKRFLPSGLFAAPASQPNGGIQQAGFFSSLLGGGATQASAIDQQKPANVNEFLRQNKPLQ